MNKMQVDHISYAVSYKELISIWIELYFQTEHIVVIYDAINHLPYLRSLDVHIDDLNVYESKILVSHLVDLDDAISLCESLCPIEGPYAEVWSMGSFITDNLEK